ncbi:hypothetical protein P7D22_16270 [Lichenihabitans sp. Uapishka_5]|uniref:hypothetical protein n=1 Tax=Lichenihabitans sp. Uapishka_5 TaxID=3037302 RepID=UPI0029E8004D|nr:hypothetical protein [Lichenihabitans sp. Uapishka_5]MDX7952724.1 hypothetical protein [Lichenihabitans sp. Uapishka_5]
MAATFKHPLARDAKVWTTGGGQDGTTRRLLVVITTLELDETHKGFKADKVARLSDAARDWLKTQATEADDFVLINRPRDWA